MLLLNHNMYQVSDTKNHHAHTNLVEQVPQAGRVCTLAVAFECNITL